MNKQKLITTLLKDHLIYTRLLSGLKDLGFESDNNNLHLSELIFELLEIDDAQDELFEAYLEWCARIKEMDILKDSHLLETYANEIYSFLTVSSKRTTVI